MLLIETGGNLEVYRGALKLAVHPGSKTLEKLKRWADGILQETYPNQSVNLPDHVYELPSRDTNTIEFWQRATHGRIDSLQRWPRHYDMAIGKGYPVTIFPVTDRGFDQLASEVTRHDHGVGIIDFGRVVTVQEETLTRPL